MAKYQCDNCDHIDDEENLPDAKDLHMRLTPGGVYTDKECPECEEHALCFPVESEFPTAKASYEEVLADHRRLVRELDVLINGDGSAPQASLCDIVSQVRKQGLVVKQPPAPAIDAFSKDDLLAILEAARVALKDERMAVRIADAMDESDRRIAELRDKLEAVMQSDVSLFAPTTKYIVCEVIEQKPAVSLHDTEEEALDHAAQCALENLKDPDDDEDNEVTRASFRDQLTEDDRICEGDYEIYILTPTNRPR